VTSANEKGQFFLFSSFRRISNQRRQFHSHHSGSSSECPTRRSNENLIKEIATEEENERSKFVFKLLNSNSN
jgi:hypothetical protein